MRKSDQPLEPSIEEILASIRKIIADDGVQGGAGGAKPFADEPARGPAPSRQTAQAPVSAYQTHDEFEPAEPAEPAGEDDIIELTEDIILEDQSGQNNPDFAEFPARPADRFVHSAIDDDSDADADAGRLAVNAKLESVFTSVAAEVERLSLGQGLKPEPAAPAHTDDWDEADHARQAVKAHAAAAESIRAQPKAPQAAAAPAAKEPEPAPQPAARSGPAVSAPRAPAPPARPQSRPVWSARHLEHEGPRSRKAKEEEEAAPPQAEAAARQQDSAALDSWAEGVQMPVPETGPTVPFAAPEDEFVSEPAAASAPPSEIEKEKDYVGGVLTRVFGRSQKKEDEAPAAAAPQSKAEKLAKTAISDFAAEKLRAPAVAEVLQADKPFMEAVTGSLETALAQVENSGPRTAAPVKPSKDMPMTEAQPAPYDELPDALLPLDSELAPFAPGQIPGFLRDNAAARQPAAAAKSAAAKATPEPSAKAPEAPQAPLRPAPSAPQAAQPVADKPAPAAPQSALPSGLEDSIKELIKPLIIQWLNDNLPRIVEKAVREELAEQGGLTSFRREGAVRR